MARARRAMSARETPGCRPSSTITLTGILDIPGRRCRRWGAASSRESWRESGRRLTLGRRRCKEEGVDSACVIVPALDAAATVGRVIDDLHASLGLTVIVVDDGRSEEHTSELQSLR